MIGVLIGIAIALGIANLITGIGMLKVLHEVQEHIELH